MSTVKIAVVYCSRYGHTKHAAESVLAGIKAEPGTEAVLLTTVEAVEKMAELDACDAIVFGAPTYMGNMASEMKIFLEATVGRWVSRGWQDKIAGGFTNSSNFSGDKLNTLEGMMITAMQLGMIWVGVNDLPGANEKDAESTVNGPSPKAVNRNSASLGPMSCSFNVKAPDAPPEGDLLTASNYGTRIARITKQFQRGK